MPDNEYRSFLFWAWNGKLEKEELQRQIHEMKAAGVGGFFMHSRDGLETEYMGNEWMEAVKVTVGEAKELGMYAWIYDEDRWPSGTAGGRVTAQGDAYRLKGMTLEICEKSQWDNIINEIKSLKKISDYQNGLQAIYAAKIQDMEIYSLRRISTDDVHGLMEGEVGLVARLEVSKPSEWFNFETPPDNLNPQCIQSFIEHTHERYKDVVGEEFGKTILGVFTDEPSLADRHAAFPPNRSWIPWTYGYGDYFKTKMGYDFLDVLPCFYFEGTKSAKARHDYWHVTALRYNEAYFQTIANWCKENNLAFTGHFLQEDKLGLATRVNGTIMTNYLQMDIPGIDMLCEQTREYMTVKQCTSVAHQFNKPLVMTETYGCTGWDFTFEGQKWIGDWQYVLGVNRRCQHLGLYSLRGCRKRDYPPSFNYNSSWWSKNKIVEDYFARLGLVLEQGKPVRNVMLLHPVTTAWNRLGSSPYGNPVRRNERDVPGINEYGDMFNHLIEKMCRNHYDCDLGDELLIQQYGKAESGRFIIGHAEYNMVVVPPVDTILRSTYDMLLQYLNQGGRLLMMAPLFKKINGVSVSTDEINRLTNHPGCVLIEDEIALWNQMECSYQREISITNLEGQQETNLLYQLREIESGFFLFVVNNNREKGCGANIRLTIGSIVEEWDLLNGTKKNIESFSDESGVEFHSYFNKSGSRLFFIPKAKKIRLESECSFKLSMPNTLTLDYCQYRLGDNEWSKDMEVWQAQYQVREKLGMRQIHLNGIEQRYKWINTPHLNDGHKLQLKFEWDSKIQMESYELVLEQPERFKIQLNGAEVAPTSNGWFLDRSFKKIELPFINQGKNSLILTCKYENDMELENCYIVGAFGVGRDRVIDELPNRLKTGDWTGQGLFHYGGNVIYEYNYHHLDTHKRIFIRIPKVLATSIEIVVNKHKIEVPWGMNEPVEITSHIKQGDNQIQIELVGSPRNIMGPFHLIGEKPVNTNDASFCPHPSEYTKTYKVVSYGIMEDVIIETL